MHALTLTDPYLFRRSHVLLPVVLKVTGHSLGDQPRKPPQNQAATTRFSPAPFPGRLEVVRAAHLLQVAEKRRLPVRSGGAQRRSVGDGETSDLLHMARMGHHFREAVDVAESGGDKSAEHRL